MDVHPVVGQNSGVITVTIQTFFNGQPSAGQDSTDKALIAAFGDPLVNIAGTFTDPNNT